jgi:hypothetical protein
MRSCILDRLVSIACRDVRSDEEHASAADVDVDGTIAAVRPAYLASPLSLSRVVVELDLPTTQLRDGDGQASRIS